jgi:purine-binding chemotaxis protein CheW
MEHNWKLIRARMADSAAAVEHGAGCTPEQRREALKARARRYALEPDAGRQVEDSFEFLEFRLASENYGIDLPFVMEVQPLRSLTSLPGTPEFIIGIINVRGKVYSVINLKKFFELPVKELSDLNKVIIIRHGNIEFGVLADAVIGVRRIPASDIQPPLPTLIGIRQKYLKGVTREQLVLLDAEKLLSDKSLIVNDA